MHQPTEADLERQLLGGAIPLRQLDDPTRQRLLNGEWSKPGEQAFFSIDAPAEAQAFADACLAPYVVDLSKNK